MAEGAYESYLKVVSKEFDYTGSWPPGSLVSVGEIGVMKRGVFVRTSSLKDKGFKFRRQTVDGPALRFATNGGVSFKATAKGSTEEVASAIAKGDAGLKITFKKQQALVFVLDSVRDERISDVDAVMLWMWSQPRPLRRDQVVITHVRRAKTGVIAMAKASGATIELKAGADLGSGEIDIGNVKGSFQLVTSTATEFVSIPSGQSGITPLFRSLSYEQGITFDGRPTGVTFKKRVVSKRTSRSTKKAR